MKVVFWLNSISPHLIPIVSMLEKSYSDLDLTIISEVNIRNDRKEMGWLPIEGQKFIIAPSIHDIDVHLAKTKENGINIFSGFSTCNLVKTSLRSAIKMELKIAIIAEASDVTGIKGHIKNLVKSLYYKKYIHNINALFCIGTSGYRWYLGSGFFPTQMAMLCYSVINNAVPKPFESDKKHFQIVYAGQLIYRKGVDVLIKAIANIVKYSTTHVPFQLAIFGMAQVSYPY
ncbi:MAG: hypothetical protein R2792_03930 [Saprospiraceae bacterium]